ncbi:MAG: hypothetical protein HY235_12725 [Acidobacteria bacterium]|nr:hypothetical protein [Acidobacteriota bacterium]
MNEKDLLKKALPPWQNTALERDLWPGMLRRLDQAPARWQRFDWALIALLFAWCLFFPELLPQLLYHL